MLADTGKMSFYMGIGFIVMAFVGILIAYRLIKSTMETARVEKIIELGKWFIVSVAIVIGATIISDGFKEREQDIKEFGVFDKYVNTIMEADGVEKRWQLAEYFSIVSPEGELRDSWERYLAVVIERRKDYLESKQKEKELEQLKNRTEEQEKALLDLKAKTQKYEEPLKPAAPVQQTPKTTADAQQEWLILAGADQTLAEAQDELKKALKVNAQARIYKRGKLFLTVVPGFASRSEAEAQLARIKLAVNNDPYIVAQQGWCKNPADNGEFITCG